MQKQSLNLFDEQYPFCVFEISISEGVRNLFFPFPLWFSSGLERRNNFSCTFRSPGLGVVLFKVLIPRRHPSPVTSDFLEGGAQASVLLPYLFILGLFLF